MNINKIKEIVNEVTLPDNIKEKLIISVIANDKDAIPTILEILAKDRSNKKELIADMNLELSRTHLYLDEYMKEGKRQSKKDFNKAFVVGKVGEFYEKYQDYVTHCFNRFNEFKKDRK